MGVPVSEVAESCVGETSGTNGGLGATAGKFVVATTSVIGVDLDGSRDLRVPILEVNADEDAARLVGVGTTGCDHHGVSGGF